MKHKTMILLVAIVGTLLSGNQLIAQTDNTKDTTKIADNEKLSIIWTSGDKDVAIKMVFMYTFNSKRFKWWKDITLVVWGPSAKLTSEDKEIQDYLKKIMESGTAVKACKACSDQYGVSEKLTELGIDVKYMGQELTDYIKSERHVITF